MKSIKRRKTVKILESDRIGSDLFSLQSFPSTEIFLNSKDTDHLLGENGGKCLDFHVGRTDIFYSFCKELK